MNVCACQEGGTTQCPCSPHSPRARLPPPPLQQGGEVGEAGWELEGSERVFPSLFSIAQLFSKRFQIILILIELFHMPADVKPRK